MNLEESKEGLRETKEGLREGKKGGNNVTFLKSQNTQEIVFKKTINNSNVKYFLCKKSDFS